MTKFEEIEAHILETHSATPGRFVLAETALKMIKDGIGHLASLGHRFELGFAALPEPEEWPKMFYHDSLGQLVVHSQQAADELSPGWRDTPKLGGLDKAPEPELVPNEPKAEDTTKVFVPDLTPVELPAAPVPEPVQVPLPITELESELKALAANNQGAV